MIEEIYAIEISGVCNGNCSYCPYPLQQRDRGFMSVETLKQTLSWIETGKLRAGRPLHLHLFGEPMLHPDFLTMARMVKEVWPYISFSTNGTGISYAVGQLMKEIGFDWITVSPHDAGKAYAAYCLLKATKNEVGMHGGPDHNWAGQVNHEVKRRAPCEFALFNKVVVRWNGDVAVCCITDNQEGVIGTVWDKDLPEKEHVAIPMCATCHLERHQNNEMSILRQIGSSS